MIGNRIKQARKASGLSMRALAEKANISAMAISKYENDQSIPSSSVVIELSKALGVRGEYFYRSEEIELNNVEYRKHSALPKKIQNQIEGNVIEQLERYFELEHFLPSRPIQEFKIPNSIPKNVRGYSDIESVAIKLREAWNLGINPIAELTDTLEERGIQVFQSDVLDDDKFDGLAVMVNSIPVIVVGKGKGWKGDRQRFTLAHELGHFILEGRIDKNILDIEKAANRFAGAFLVPESEARKELGEKRSWFEPKELYVLKHAYGFSMGGWLHRAHELEIISDQNYKRMIIFFRKQGWHKNEPGGQLLPEKPQLFEQLVFRALAEDLIGESKAAELMSISVRDFRDIRRNMESAENINNQ